MLRAKTCYRLNKVYCDLYILKWPSAQARWLPRQERPSYIESRLIFPALGQSLVQSRHTVFPLVRHPPLLKSVVALTVWSILELPMFKLNISQRTIFRRIRENTMASTPFGGNVRLTFLTTGTVRIRPSMRAQPVGKFAILRRLRSLCDNGWTEPLPVGVFLIHHREGLFLMDTGQSPCCNDAGYFPRLAIFNDFLSEFTIEREDGIVEQLHRIGIKATDLKAVILSHLHNDHAGGLEDLIAEAPDLPVYVSRKHWESFGKHPHFASMEGATPNHWPKKFSLRVVDLQDRPLGPWKQSYPLTEDGSIVIVDTSGHVPGHISLVVYSDREKEEGKRVTYFLPGDATYGLDLLDKEEPDGINNDPMLALQTIKKIKEFARGTDVVVLPSHDKDTPRLLAEEIVYRPNI